METGGHTKDEVMRRFLEWWGEFTKSKEVKKYLKQDRYYKVVAWMAFLKGIEDGIAECVKNTGATIAKLRSTESTEQPKLEDQHNATIRRVGKILDKMKKVEVVESEGKADSNRPRGKHDVPVRRRHPVGRRGKNGV